MLCGIVAFAVGVEAAAAHPGEALFPGARLALAAGFLLFVGGTAVALWRAAGQDLWVRLFFAIGTSTVVAAVEGLPHLSLGIMLVAISTVVVLEHRSLGHFKGDWP